MCVWKSEYVSFQHDRNILAKKTKMQLYSYIGVVEMEEIVSYMKLVNGVAGFVCIKLTINCKVSYSLT
jgi:hypothetical protein